MNLQPCSSCRRHVADREHACPFCGAPLTTAPAPSAPKRLTRAAIFASTVLAVPACWSSSAPKQTPIDNTSAGSGSGQAADDVPSPKAGTGTIIITVVDSNTGNAVPGRWVRLVGGQSPANQQVATDADGNATFANVPPGTYQAQSHDGNPRHSPSSLTVRVEPDEVSQQTMTVSIPTYNSHNVPMPYGAPPARRRIV